MDKKTGIELMPCPHCGGTDLSIGFNAVEERHYVVCSHCLMRGPEKLADEDRAAKYWNARSRRSPMPSLTSWKNWQERRRRARGLPMTTRKMFLGGNLTTGSRYTP